MSREEKKGNKEKHCNHFMVWNIQGGYSYYRCDNCNYIDGKKTFEAQKQELREKIEKILHKCECENGDCPNCQRICGLIDDFSNY